MSVRSTPSTHARTRLLIPLTFTLGVCGLFASPFGCSSTSVGPEDASVADARNDDGAVRGEDDSGDGSEVDSSTDASVDVRGDAGDGTYWQGPYLCCAEGQGRSCCPPEMLPDPDAGRIATCFQYGGVLNKCTGLGEFLEAKDICSLCCPGLSRVESLAPADGGGIRIGNVECAPTNYSSVFGCTPCGDGVCDEGENACNCPGDCGNPLDAGTLPEAGPVGDDDGGNVPEGGPIGPGGDGGVTPEGGLGPDAGPGGGPGGPGGGPGAGDAGVPDAIAPPPPPFP